MGFDQVVEQVELILYRGGVKLDAQGVLCPRGPLASDFHIANRISLREATFTVATRSSELRP